MFFLSHLFYFKKMFLVFLYCPIFLYLQRKRFFWWFLRPTFRRRKLRRKKKNIRGFRRRVFRKLSRKFLKISRYKKFVLFGRKRPHCILKQGRVFPFYSSFIELVDRYFVLNSFIRRRLKKANKKLKLKIANVPQIFAFKHHKRPSLNFFSVLPRFWLFYKAEKV